MAVQQETSLGSLVSGIVGDLQNLVRNEIALARQEVHEEINTAKSAAIKLGIAVAVLAIGGLLLIIALSLGIADLFNWPSWAGFALTGVVLAAVGGVLVYLGQRDAKNFSPVPQKTVETMKENVEWVKDRTTSNRT